MKPRLSPPRALTLAAAAAILAYPSGLLAQLSDLPVKAGLWETHVLTKAGANAMDAGPGRACFTAGTTMGDYLTATNKNAPGVKCTISNKVVTAHGISYDTECTGATASSKGHIDLQVPDTDHFNGNSHTTVSRTSHGKSQTMAIDKTFSAKFLGPTCGDVEPLLVPGKNSD
jgi:uncharacterized membrane protein